MIGYASGMRKRRVTILNKAEAQANRFGLDAGGTAWNIEGTVWASIDFVRGMRTLNAGAIDAYGVIMVRMNWNNKITMRSRIVYDSMTYQLLPETFHADRQGNIIQFNAQAIINEGENNSSSYGSL